MRGKHVSKPIEEVIREANELTADGVRELIVVAQDTTYYGLDLYGATRLAELLRRLDEVEGIRWVRILYAYPAYFSDDLIQALAGAKKIIPYLDMPLQHINDEMLRRMSRRVTRAETEDLLEKLRDGIPQLTLRTTFITGFPGETEEHFAELAQRQRCHHKAAALKAYHESGWHQSRQRFAEGACTNFVGVTKLADAQPGSRLQLSTNDVVAKRT